MGTAHGLTRAIIGVGALLALSLIALAVVWITRTSPQEGRQGPKNPLRTVSLASANTDPRTIEATELFSAESFSSHGRTYEVLGTDTAATCTNAGAGPNFADTMEESDCRGVARGTVIDSTGAWVITMGVADLRDEAAAQEVDELLNEPDNIRFTIMPAGRAQKPTSRHFIKVGHQVEGHYVLFLAVTKLRGGEIDNNDPAMLRIFQDCTDHLLAGLKVHSLTGG